MTLNQRAQGSNPCTPATPKIKPGEDHRVFALAEDSVKLVLCYPICYPTVFDGVIALC